MRALLAVATAVILVGCSQNGGSSEKPNEAMDPPVDQVPGSTNTGGGDSDPVGSTQGGVGTVTAGATAGGMTPMTGTDSVGGGGYGVGSAAKDQAREAASQAGAGSMGQADSDQ
ncbi:MAG: hypothetical protein HONBIEJF_01476 [Fimbriimonadaceae bacterium]|nr:hypothetical protein [Fimbriimonadaceae bacterium]